MRENIPWADDDYRMEDPADMFKEPTPAPAPAIKTDFNAALHSANKRTPAALPDFKKL